MVNRLIICAIFLQLFINCRVFGQNGSDEKYGNEITIQKINDFMEKTEINELKYKELSKKWMEKDTSISINDITFLRCYFTTTPEYNPIKIDELSAQIYNLNKTEKFQEAIELCSKLEDICPYNLTSYKESAYALNKLNTEFSNKWNNALKIAKSMLFYSDNATSNNRISGLNSNPFFALSLYEGIICYDMSFGSYPEKSAIVKYDKEQLLGVYFAHSASTRWAYLNHAKSFYPRFIDQTNTEVIVEYSKTTETLKDIDGNSYHTVKIGNSEWMAENLRVTKFNDGTIIPNVNSTYQWTETSTPAYRWYKDNQVGCEKNNYGALYNWFVVNSSITENKNVCPIGWHVPTDSEWSSLVQSLDSAYNDKEKVSLSSGKKLKYTAKWYYCGNGTNETGFTAIPSGYLLFFTGPRDFMDAGRTVVWWSSTQENDDSAWVRVISYEDDSVAGEIWEKKHGISIRCKKD